MSDVLSNTFLSSLDTASADGTWPDVDYTAGCPARRANWPAQVHWLHIRMFITLFELLDYKQVSLQFHLLLRTQDCYPTLQIRPLRSTLGARK